MERSPTLFDHFPGFRLSPLFYDGIRPGRQRTGICTEGCRAEESSPNLHSPDTAKNDLAVEEFRRQRNEKQVTTIDLTATPRVLNQTVQARGVTATAQPKSGWTVIPIKHVNSPRDSQKSSLPQGELSIKQQDVTNVQSDETCSRESSQDDGLERVKSQTSNNHISSPARPDACMKVEIARDNFHQSSSNTLERSDLLSSLRPEHFINFIAGDGLPIEQDINPAPSYPVYGELKTKLQKENRQIDYIRGDGNCFFRAISKQLYGTEKFHKSIRSLVVDITATNKSAFAQFIDGQDVQAHVDRMSEENVWATTCEIYAAATLLQREIYMLTPDHNNTNYSWLLFKPLFKISSQSENSQLPPRNDKSVEILNSSSPKAGGGLSDHPCYLTFCNTNGNHYDRVVADHGGCNCFLPFPHLDGHSVSVDLTELPITVD